MSRDDLTAQRLPRGRHGLSRREVVQSQRGRIFYAMAEVMAQKGYAATSVSQVLRTAGVSRETFYQQFSSKEDCFMSALETAVDVIFAATLGAAEDHGSPTERFDTGIRDYLDALAAYPEFARMFLIEVYAAGPAAIARRAALQDRYAGLVNEVFGGRTEEDRFANEALVLAISAMVTARLVDDDVEGLRALHAPLMKLAARLHPN